LLVVIGIIALLVGILLPALGAARRQAGKVKCAAALREVGTCFKLYEIDNKGYWPVARLNGYKKDPSSTAGYYNIDGVDYPVGSGETPGSTHGNAQAHWTVFLAKYATKTKVGGAASVSDTTNSQLTRNSIFYGCPAWQGYSNGLSVGDTNLVQYGYGMNPFPTFSATYPRLSVATSGFPPENPKLAPSEYAVHDVNEQISTTKRAGDFLKAKTWTRPTERMLVSDSTFWLSQSNNPPVQSSYPPAVVPQMVPANVAFIGSGQTTVDLYRHGTNPRQIGNGNFDANGGKIAYNILYCDGHVATATDGREAYFSQRMKFPG